MIYQFENNYDRHIHGYEYGWVGHIPYYNCSVCTNRIMGVYKGNPLITRYIYTGTEQRCIRCVKKIIKGVTRCQAYVRGYCVRKRLLNDS